jgi:hypothetical protein
MVLGIVLLLLGTALVLDAWVPKPPPPTPDRRHRPRTPLDPVGELAAGIGVGLLGIAFLAHNTRFETLIIIAAAICVSFGALKNWKYFREVLLFRRSEVSQEPKIAEESSRIRIR